MIGLHAIMKGKSEKRYKGGEAECGRMLKDIYMLLL